MKKTRSNSKLYQYLLDHSADFADKEAVAFLKKQFYKEYNRKLRKQKIQEQRVVTITIPKQAIRHLRKRCKEQGSDVPTYIKQLIKADITNTTAIEQTLIFFEIKQILHNTKQTIESIEEKSQKRWFGNNDYTTLYTILTDIHHTITHYLNVPK